MAGGQGVVPSDHRQLKEINRKRSISRHLARTGTCFSDELRSMEFRNKTWLFTRIVDTRLRNKVR